MSAWCCMHAAENSKVSEPLYEAECAQFIFLKTERAHDVLRLATRHWKQSLSTHTKQVGYYIVGIRGLTFPFSDTFADNHLHCAILRCAQNLPYNQRIVVCLKHKVKVTNNK